MNKLAWFTSKLGCLINKTTNTLRRSILMFWPTLFLLFDEFNSEQKKYWLTIWHTKIFMEEFQTVLQVVSFLCNKTCFRVFFQAWIGLFFLWDRFGLMNVCCFVVAGGGAEKQKTIMCLCCCYSLTPLQNKNTQQWFDLQAP